MEFVQVLLGVLEVFPGSLWCLVKAAVGVSGPAVFVGIVKVVRVLVCNELRRVESIALPVEHVVGLEDSRDAAFF